MTEGERFVVRKPIEEVQVLRGGKREGAGRPAGAPNKATAEVMALAQQYTEDAVKELARLALHAESEQARVSAIKELLDRGYGKSKQALEHGGRMVFEYRDPTQGG